MSKSRRAYKLFRVRADGSLSSLFIDSKQRLPIGKWLKADTHPTKGFAVRHGWHALGKPVAPHLSLKGRRWYVVEIQGYTAIERPAHQGSEWFLAERLRIIEPAEEE